MGPQTEKLCAKCNAIKDRSAFRLRKNGITLQAYCSECADVVGRKWAKDNRDRACENTRNWRKNNAERAKFCRQELYRRNLDRARKIGRMKYQRSADKLRARRREYVKREDVKAKLRIYNNNRRRTNINARLAHVLRSRLWDALKRRAKRGSAVALLGCPIDDARKHLEKLFQPGMSWDNLGDWHIDHKQPLSAVDLTDERQLAVVCHYTNLQPLWAFVNQSKGDRIINEQSADLCGA